MAEESVEAPGTESLIRCYTLDSNETARGWTRLTEQLVSDLKSVRLESVCPVKMLW